MSTSLATGIAKAEVHTELEKSSPPTSSSRQPPPAIAAAETAAAEGPTVAPTYDRPTRRAHSLSARTPSFHSLSPPVLSPAYVVEQPESVLHRTGRAASSQRVVSQRAPSSSPNQSTFSYGAPSPPVGSDIEAEYPAARPSVFRPRLIDIRADADPTPPRPAAAGADSARPVAASVDQGRMSLPYASVDVFAGMPSAVIAHPGSLDVATPRTRMRSETHMPSSDVGQRGLANTMRIDVPRPLDLTLLVASSDVEHPYAPLSVDVDITVLFCSLAVLDPRVGHTMDVLSPFIPVLCHSD